MRRDYASSTPRVYPRLGAKHTSTVGGEQNNSFKGQTFAYKSYGYAFAMFTDDAEAPLPEMLKCQEMANN